ADRFEQAGVGGRIAASGSLDRCLIDHHHAVPTAQRALDEAALAGTCDTGDDGEHAERHVDVDIAQIVCRRSPDLQGARGLTYSVLERGGVSEVATGQGVAATQLVDGAGEGDLSPAAPGPGTEVDDVIGDEDRPRFVFDDEDGVALV